MLVGVAMRLQDGTVVSLPRPARHPNLMKEYNEHCREDGWDFPWEGWPAETLKGSEQGFVDTVGTFYTREEGEKYAREIGQVKGELIGGPLTSEDLW